MPFTLQDPVSGLFWTSGIFGRVQLGTTPKVYTLEGSYIKNTETGNYVNHRAELFHAKIRKLLLPARIKQLIPNRKLAIDPRLIRDKVSKRL